MLENEEGEDREEGVADFVVYRHRRKRKGKTVRRLRANLDTRASPKMKGKTITRARPRREIGRR